MVPTTPIRRYPIPTRRHPPPERVPVPARALPWQRTTTVIAGLTILSLVLAYSLVLPAIRQCQPLAMDVSARLEGPSVGHWLGTDQFGRDVCCRVSYGARISLPVGVIAVIIALVPGLALGLLAGYWGGWVDTVIGRLVDVALAFPGILLTLLIVAWLGPGLTHTMIAIELTGIPTYVRLSRSSTLQIKRAWFVRAAHIVGVPDLRILVRHVLPSVLPSVIALATLDVAWAILNAATLSFLGLGAPPPTPEWGAMINEGRGFLRQAPWISLAPGALMVLTVLGINLLGDGLRDALDPLAR
jgi:ABC-type dipeptide/oligopeptide/nickel transport system permease subunit